MCPFRPGRPPRAAVPSEDDYLTKLLKYVPTEVLGAYLLKPLPPAGES